MVSAKRIVEIPDLGPVVIEVGTVRYKCKSCDFDSKDPQAASDHDFEENKRRRYDSQWRHEIEVVASRDEAVPCPLCNGISSDLKNHLFKEHGKSPNRLVDMILLLQDQNTRLIGVARSLQATVRTMSKGRLRVRRNKQSSTSNGPSMDDEDLEEC